MAAEKFVIFKGNTQVSYLPNAQVHGRGGGGGGGGGGQGSGPSRFSRVRVLKF